MNDKLKTLVVGDLHGKYEIVQKVLSLNQPTVFVGDYLDSYDRSPEDCCRTLVEVLTAIQNRDDVVGLLGNHELSYLYPEMACSGYQMATQSYVNLLRDQMLSLLKYYHEAEGFLISHAGVSQDLLNKSGETVQEYLEAGVFHDIGTARGGRSWTGGLTWCDWNVEFNPVPGVKQIVGHTRDSLIREKDGNYCVDCLEDGEGTILAIEDGEAEVWKLDEL